MDTEIKPKRSDPYDARPVIKYAAQRAVKTGKDQYVESSGGRWRHTIEQPKPCWSHWKVDHMAELYAHIGDMGVIEYNYEKVGDDNGARP